MKNRYIKGQVWDFYGEQYRIRSVDYANKTVALEYMRANMMGDPDQAYAMKYMEDSEWKLVSQPDPTQVHLRRWVNAVR